MEKEEPYYRLSRGLACPFFFLFSSFFSRLIPEQAVLPHGLNLGGGKATRDRTCAEQARHLGYDLEKLRECSHTPVVLLFLQLVLFLVELTSCVHNGSRQFNRPRHRGGKDRKMRTAPENGPASFALVAIWLRAIF